MAANLQTGSSAFVAAALVALAGCGGEVIDVGDGPGATMAPARAGTPVATSAALESGTSTAGRYESADGTVTGTYDRATDAFDLVKREPADAAPLLERAQVGRFLRDAAGATTGADYVERLRYASGLERVYPVEYRMGAASDSVRWVYEGGAMTRDHFAEMFDDASWTMAYMDEDPATETSPDAAGDFVVNADGSWSGTYAARWDDGSRLDETLSAVLAEGVPVHIEYTWDDAATPQSPDETGVLSVEPSGRTFGTVTRHDESGTPSCFDVDVDGGAYFETPTDC